MMKSLGTRSPSSATDIGSTFNFVEFDGIKTHIGLTSRRE